MIIVISPMSNVNTYFCDTTFLQQCLIRILQKDCELHFGGGDMFLTQAYELFRLEKETYCSEKTLVYYDFNVTRFIEYCAIAHNCHKNLLQSNAITRDDILKYILMLRGSGVKNTSINTYFRAVKVFLNFCIYENWCDPTLLTKIKFLKSDQEEIIPLTDDEVSDLDGCYSIRTENGLRNLCLIHLMLDAGLRSFEVVGLRYQNVNFDKNYIQVFGKGSKYRTVLLCPRLKKLLYRYVLIYRSDFTSDRSFIFSQIGSSEPITEDVVKQVFARMKKRSGVDRVHPHLLRHTFATSYIMGGGNMEFLRLMLGHSEYETTKLYLHLAAQSKMLRQDVYKLDPVFFKTMY